MILEVYELGFMILVISIGLEPYPIGSEIILDFLKILANPNIVCLGGLFDKKNTSVCSAKLKQN